MLRIPFEQMYNEFLRVLRWTGFTQDRAELCARLFAEASRDGVYTHGLNRFPSFINFIQKGFINISSEPVKIESSGVIERWDGNSGPGNLNAYFSMNRAMELAKENGMGCVALKNTNHWMRAGSYGWQAADSGLIGICWTNTLPNMPVWGSIEAKVGNNPVVLAVPRPEGHLILDIAMSQYSYGQLNSYKSRNEQLSVYGGYDREGELSKDPAEILESGRTLPIGFWKGSGLSLMLDMIGMILSGGKSTYEIGSQEAEYGISQVFIAIDPSRLSNLPDIYSRIQNSIDDLHNSIPADEKSKVRYPGEGTLRIREDNLKNGIPVDETIWNTVLQIGK